VIADDEVLTDFGTGALKITPAHSLEDFEIGKRHNLEIINSINPNGTLNEVTGKYNNMAVTEARIAILKDLEALNLIAKIEDYTHSIGYSEDEVWLNLTYQTMVC
jgi:valyl-tRNA synthetase